MGGGDNYVNTNPHKELDIDVRKVPADSVPMATASALAVAMCGLPTDAQGTRIAVAATAKAARRKCLEHKWSAVNNLAEKS